MRRTAKAVALGAALLFVLGVSSVTAQSQGSDSDINADESSLFGGDEVVESPAQGPKQSTDPLASTVKTAQTRVGGSFSGSLTPSLVWNDIWDGSSPLLAPETRSLASTLASTIFFDARPKEDFRVYGSFKVAWPFSSTNTVLTSPTSAASITTPNIKVFELFADYSYNDMIFFRFGKSTVKWGVGYFWSPADVINLESINVLDATAQREGPINFRVHIPVLGTQNNFYFYTILDKDSVAFETTALAARAEFLLGTYELGIGAYYRYDTAERAMATVTGPLGDFDVFGEAMVSRGSANTFVESIGTSSPYTITTSTTSGHRDQYYFSASAGALYSSPKDYVTAIAQYYYNGEGYSDATRSTLISDAKTALASATIGGNTASVAKLSAALAGLVYGSGQHYAAMSFSKNRLIGKYISASVIAVANLSDGSGFVKPAISWVPLDYLTLSLSPLFVFGPADGEYAFLAGGDKVSLSLGITVSGSF
jgi:hypothetical protein